MTRREPRARAAGGRIVRGSAPGAGWLDLLDPHQADRLCNAVRVAVENLAVGYPSDLHVDLRAELILPAASYLVEHWQDHASESRSDIAACRALIDLAERLAEQIEDRHPFHEGGGALYARPLRERWSAFIEHTAAPEVIHGRAQRSRTAADNASRLRKPRVSTQTRETLTRELLLQRLRAGKARGELKKTVQHSLAVEFGVSPRQQDRDIAPLTWRDLTT
ncbi:MAG: hypothetical protein Q8K45_19400 [Rubrivivax sp.]|nr:hypothetical protein [Rubrivivax sp.]